MNLTQTTKEMLVILAILALLAYMWFIHWKSNNGLLATVSGL
jgi:Tfp pilus assembly protein FimT